MTKAEAVLISGFLRYASNELGNAGCNDMVLPLKEYKKLAEEAEREQDDEFEGLSVDKKHIYTSDHVVLDHVRKKFNQENNITEKDVNRIFGKEEDEDNWY